MTFSGGNSSRHRRRRLAMEVAGHRGRGNEMSRRATARLRPPEPDEPLPVEYTRETAAAVLAMGLEPASDAMLANGKTLNGSVEDDQAWSDSMVETFNGNGLALELEPAAEVDQTNGIGPGLESEPVAEVDQTNGIGPGLESEPVAVVEQANGIGPALESEPLVEVPRANGSASAGAPGNLGKQINGHKREPMAEETGEPQPVRFKWDPKTGQAVPVT